VRFDEVEAGVLYIDVRYSVRGTNDPRNLVFPFYVIPEHEEGVARQQAAATPGALTTAGPAGRR
jgi:hypothetical protein